MLAGTYLNWLEKITGGSFTRADLLSSLNSAHNRILGRDIRPMLVTPRPILETTDGTNEYQANASIAGGALNGGSIDFRRITKIFDKTRPQYYWVYPYGYHPYSIYPDRTPAVKTREPEDRITNYRKDADSSLEAGDDLAYIKFWNEFNPGTTTDKYYVEGYRWPNQLTTENATIELPAQFHRTLLRFEILSELEYTEYGRNQHPSELAKRYDDEYLAYVEGDDDVMEEDYNNIREF